MMTISGFPDMVICFQLAKESVMAAGMVSVYLIGTAGITAAVIALLISRLGSLVLMYGVRYLEDDR